jgi:hypothetical protein
MAGWIRYTPSDHGLATSTHPWAALSSDLDYGELDVVDR